MIRFNLLRNKKRAIKTIALLTNHSDYIILLCYSLELRVLFELHEDDFL